MKLLLDTHALLWLITEDDRLSFAARNIFLSSENELYFSAVSFWEIGIKISLKKLILKKEWVKIIKKELVINEIQWLPVDMNHCEIVAELPFHHRDPFDRMLIAQAMVEGLNILSCDGMFSKYDVTSIW